MFDLLVKYEDGTEATVSVGQREMAAWELAGHGSSVTVLDTAPMAFFRFAAYKALRRLGQLPENKIKGAVMPFEAWDDLVEEVHEPDEEIEAVPTTPDQPQEG